MISNTCNQSLRKNSHLLYTNIDYVLVDLAQINELNKLVCHCKSRLSSRQDCGLKYDIKFC